MRTVLAALFLFSSPVLADDVGIPVTVRVTDTAGNAIPTAVVRHPVEKDRHRVHTQTGDWTASVLYLPNGDELVFRKNELLELEISAPGYRNARIKYLIRKRRNLVPVVLEEADSTLGDPEDPVIPFGRSVPIDQ